MPRQVDHAARRAAIEDAVLTIAGERGFPAVTIRAIAERIGTSTTAVTHYVDSREDLLRTAIHREIAARIAEAQRAIGARRGEAGLRALLEWAVLSRHDMALRLWLAMIVGAHTEPVLRAELDVFITWWDARVHTLLTEAGVADPAAASDLIDVVADGLVISGFEEAQPWDRDRRRRVLTRLWQLLGT